MFRSSRGKIVLTYLAALAVFVGLNALLFRTGLYRSAIEPDSYAGQAETLHRIASGDAAPSQVLVLGDSRIAEGFSAKLANARDASSGLDFVNGAIPASTPRCWYYILRDLDPAATKYRAVVLAVDDYNDEDGAWDWADRLLDLRILVFRLRVEDVWDFARSFHGVRERFEAALGGLLRGVVLKDDVQALLAHPRDRLGRVELYNRSAAGALYNYEGNPRSLSGLAVNWTTHRIAFPVGLSDGQKAEFRAALFRVTLPQNGSYARYRKLWLGRIVDRYRNSGTRIVFVRLPRGPAPRNAAPGRFAR
ncbi:MAG: hypothetical protein ABI165_06220, partial [Bryobacteraceae bacterium]